MSGTTEQRRERLARVAIELQQREDARRQVAVDADHQKAALSELGVEERFWEQAAVEIDRQDAAAAARSRDRVRVGWLVGGAAAAVAIAVAVVAVGAGMAREAPAGWEEPLDQPGSWALDVNPGTVARLAFAPEDGRGQVAVVTVERFAVDGEGQHRANLDGFGVPASLQGYEALELDLAGTLPVARVYLEAGPDERWRSPALSVTPEWSRRTLALQSFEHQVRADGKWHTEGSPVPTGLTGLSIKLGHFMNGPEAVGELRVDAIRLR